MLDQERKQEVLSNKSIKTAKGTERSRKEHKKHTQVEQNSGIIIQQSIHKENDKLNFFLSLHFKSTAHSVALLSSSFAVFLLLLFSLSFFFIPPKHLEKL